MLLILLAGCNTPLASTSNDNGAVSTIVDNSTPTTPSISTLAPSYEEIKKTIDEITERVEHPEGPSVGLDGLTDPHIREEFGNYNVYLRDKIVQNWQGWIGNFTQNNPDDASTTYNLGIFMQDPNLDNTIRTGVLQSDVSRTQLEIFASSIDLNKSFGSWKNQWPHISFSGTIQGILTDGRVIIDNVVIKELR